MGTALPRWLQSAQGACIPATNTSFTMGWNPLEAVVTRADVFARPICHNEDALSERVPRKSSRDGA